MDLLNKQRWMDVSTLAGLAGAFLFVTTGSGMATPDIKSLRVDPVKFSGVPGWRKDDQRQALTAFLRSCAKLSSKRDGLGNACRRAQKLPQNISDSGARAFFESYFQPYKVRSGGALGRLTGYYEPILRGSRVRTDKYTVPIYRRPKDLIGLHSSKMRYQARRNGLSSKLTYAQRTSKGLRPYMTREQIERGGLSDRGLEILWLADPVDAFFLHIQGSGIVHMEDGSRVRIGFDGKNGYDYTSVGRALVQAGLMSARELTLDGVKAWLRANPEKGRKAMWRNKSFIFFRELPVGQGGEGPIGAQGIPLTNGRSLAVDRRHYRLGLPVFLNVRGFKYQGEKRLARLMVAQDTGTAIKGAKRGDIFWGSGDEAGEIAGRTYHRGEFYVLLPRRKPLRRSFVNLPGDHAFSQFSTLNY
jgi:membrane-bound lytic murein transglycosylase A